MKKYAAIAIALALLAGATAIVVTYYPFLFAKTVVGVVMKVEHVNQNDVIISGATGNNPKNVPSTVLFSFAVSIKDPSGEIHTASSEDRQWAVAQTGQCAEAKFLPYPPWNLEKAGTYHGARLIRLYECDKHQ